jgi:hypothetical protein
MYSSSGATLRADLNGVVEDAFKADSMFIGDRACPPVLVDAKSGTYPKLSIADAELLTAGSTVRSRGGEYGKVSRKWGNDTYDCIDRGLEEPVDDVDVKDLQRFFPVEAFAARLVLRNMRTDFESRAAAVINSATNWGAGTNSAVAYTEANIATISLIADILAAIERVRDNGADPNTIVMSSTVWNRVRRGTLVLNFVRGSVAANAEVTPNTLQQALADEGIEQVLIGRSRENTAKKGQAKSMSSIWGTTYVWVGYVSRAAATLYEVGACATLVWNAEGGLFVSETYRDEGRRSNIVRVRQNTTEKCINATLGTLITTQWA